MSDEQTYIKFAIADFTRVMEYAAACKSMLGTQICDAVVDALKKRDCSSCTKGMGQVNRRGTFLQVCLPRV